MKMGMVQVPDVALHKLRAFLDDRIDPGFEKSYVRVAKCCLALGDIIGTEHAVKMVSELKWSQSTAVAGEQAAVQKLRQLEATIQTNYDTKAYRNVVFYLDSALKLAPACLKYRLLKAECLAFLGRCDEALDIAVGVMKLDTTSADAIYVRGLCLYFTDNLDKGILHFERALTLDPDHHKSKQMRSKCKQLKEMKENGNMLFKSGRYREAHVIYTDALKIDEHNKDINAAKSHNGAVPPIFDYSSHEPKFRGNRGVNLVLEPLDKAQVVIVHTV
ncbi:dnaJ homolog subfamily C member 7-like [Drosophila santomea]|uniref:dnaJ homolog subfamily C member 7-like n=1 Tax=Drosophila santomea TaxID=129105 RepID=UPI001CCC692F|nr:dnaJ homolog subfamily C member 7-like [Drosophila santomea]